MSHIYSFYTDSFGIALQSILMHKLRGFLTLIGIIIGVASVVLVGASIDGLNSYIVDKLSDEHNCLLHRAFNRRFGRHWNYLWNIPGL